VELGDSGAAACCGVDGYLTRTTSAGGPELGADGPNGRFSDASGRPGW
jgi:hypothetical protein